MTDTLVERLARAISIPQHHTSWDTLSEREKDLFLMQAEYAAYEINSVLTAGRALLDAAEKHIFGDECKAERDAFRAALNSDAPLSVGEGQ